MRECGCQCGHERGVCHTDWTRDGREFGGGVTVKRDLSTQTTAIRITIRTTVDANEVRGTLHIVIVGSSL